MAGRPVIDYRNCRAEAVYLGDGLVSEDGKLPERSKREHQISTFFVLEYKSWDPNTRLMRAGWDKDRVHTASKPSNDIIFLQTEKTIEIKPGTRGILDFQIGNPERVAPHRFKDFSKNTSVDRTFIKSLIEKKHKKYIYALAVLENSGFDLDEISSAQLMKTAWKEGILSIWDYAWLLYILDREKTLQALAKGHDIVKGYYFLYLLEKAKNDLTLQYLLDNRNVLRVVLAEMHNSQDFTLVGPVKIRKKNERLKLIKKLKESLREGQTLVDLDLTKVAQTELHIRNKDDTKAHDLVREIFKKDKKALIALTPTHYFGLKPWVRYEGPVLYRVPFLDGKPNHIGQTLEFMYEYKESRGKRKKKSQKKDE